VALVSDRVVRGGCIHEGPVTRSAFGFAQTGSGSPSSVAGPATEQQRICQL